MLLCFSILLLSKPRSVFSQTGLQDSSYQKQFAAFNNSINKDFNSFRQHNDSVFLQFLAQSWKEFDGVKNKIPSPPKPVKPPIYKAPEIPVVPKADSAVPASLEKPKDAPLPESKTPGIDNTSKLKESEIPEQKLPLEHELSPDKLKPVPDQEALSIVSPMAKIEYFGTDFSVPATMHGLPVLSAISKQGIIDYYKVASSNSQLNMAALMLKKESNERRLNDWGLANLLMKAAQNMYNSPNDQVMFTWFALLRSGFNVKIGYNGRNVYLLLPSNEMLYEYSYTVNGRAYYLLNFGTGQAEPEQLTIHEADYPQATSGLSFMITQTPELSYLFTRRTLLLSHPLELKLNKNLVNFYASYPQCELKVFFAAPLSANAINQLDAYFIPALGIMKDDERVAFLLKFVHESIPYKTDEEQFGHEKYLFADETLYYPAADCEDRAVF